MAAIEGELSLEQSGSLQTLPLELVLRIIETLALDLRDSAPTRARSLLLISRAVRQSLLPLIYGALVIDIDQTTGRDGQPCTHPAHSFLLWLLGTPSPEPRRHIKNLALCRNSSAAWLRFVRDIKASNPSWFLDNLIVTIQEDAQHLERAGISTRAAHWIARITGDIFGTSIGQAVITVAKAFSQDAEKDGSAFEFTRGLQEIHTALCKRTAATMH